MSYDYNALVSAIASHRRKAMDDPSTHLQQAVDTFSTLSTLCPMTPLLWLQYASDASKLIQLLLNSPDEAMEMRLQTLELGMGEFPGCAVMRLHYLELLVDSSKDYEKIFKAFEDALRNVGQGSHRNEGEIVANIYRLYANYLVSQKQHEKLVEVFARRAQAPMKDANDALMDEFQQLCRAHNIPITADSMQKIEEGRMWAAKIFNSLATWEDEVDVAMNEEEILTRHEISLEDMDWESLIQSEQGRFWMGLGGAKTANAFVKYARACAKYSSHSAEQQETDTQRVRALALCVYERGVSECPTVESLWLSYLRHLTHLVSIKDTTVTASKLQNVATRAARNCPYSLALYQQKLDVLAVLAKRGQTVLDPDAVMAIVQEAIDAKFLPTPQSYLDLHLSAIRIVKSRIMSIVSEATSPKDKQLLAYDDAEPMEKVGAKASPATMYANLDAETEQEVQDLVEDLREMYDTSDTYLRKNHNSWTQGRSLLWKDRAKTESFLLGPLMASLEDSHNEQEKNKDLEMTRCYEKLVRLQQPTHPDYFTEYIHSVMGNISMSTPGEVLVRLRKVRGLYQKALMSVKKHQNGHALEPTQNTLSSSHRDAEVALHCLCYEYLNFEQCFGSPKSFENASKSVEKKLQTAVANGGRTSCESIVPMSTDADKEQANAEDPVVNEKRKLDDRTTEQPPSKKPKSTKEDERTNDMEIDKTEKKVNLKVVKHHPVHKVRVGELEYPAHPFTVRVSNLSLDTEDMDLVDLFKERCGPIVHARILREKHYQAGKGKSKGCGLVQFEERESVEKALQLDEQVGLHEKLVKVQRSHMHAAEIVPPGMHRVNPKGKGRSSKRNQSRKKQHGGGNTQDASQGDKNLEKRQGKDDHPKAGEKPKARDVKSRKPDAGILAFRPRGVAHGQGHHKVYLKLDDDEKAASK